MCWSSYTSIMVQEWFSCRRNESNFKHMVRTSIFVGMYCLNYVNDSFFLKKTTDFNSRNNFIIWSVHVKISHIFSTLKTDNWMKDRTKLKWIFHGILIKLWFQLKHKTSQTTLNPRTYTLTREKVFGEIL